MGKCSRFGLFWSCPCWRYKKPLVKKLGLSQLLSVWVESGGFITNLTILMLEGPFAPLGRRFVLEIPYRGCLFIYPHHNPLCLLIYKRPIFIISIPIQLLMKAFMMRILIFSDHTTSHIQHDTLLLVVYNNRIPVNTPHIYPTH